jgi:hypothetical protein
LADDGYDAVRRGLRERGYLTSPVERFVLLPQITRGSALPGVLAAGAKAALVVGPLLGVLLALVLAWSEWPLARATDLPLLWLYLVAPATLAVFLLDLTTALGVALIARRRGVRSGAADPGRAGAVAGLVVLVYLLLLWWARAGERPVIENALFVLLAFPVVLAIGHLAGLVSLAGVMRRTGELPEPRRRRGAIVIAGVLAFGALALTAIATLLAGAGAAGLKAHPPTRSNSRVIVIGIDGLDGALVSTLGERGALEHLLARLELGATFPLRRNAPAEPAEVWTTIATGLPAELHGVRAAQAERLPGVGTTLRGALPLWKVWSSVLPLREVPASRGIRRAPAIWEIAAPFLGSAVVDWWATWPAPEDETAVPSAPARYVVSDRVLTKLLTDSPADRDTAPEALYGRIRASFGEEVAGLRREFELAFTSLPPKLVAWAWESFLIDGFACARLREVLEDDRVTAAFVYLPGLDILRHRLAGQLDSMKVLELYASSLDKRLAPLFDSRAPTLVIVADRGRSPGEGFVSISAERAIPACVGSALSDLDVAPLLLRELGFGASAEMPGRAPEDCFEARARLASVPSYGRLPVADRREATSESDPEVLDRLRSLGYLR